MRIFLISIFLLCYLSGFTDEKKALKHLEKAEFEKVIETLDKEILKDSLNPGPYYIYSLLFNHQDFPNHNIDTSYSYILKAQSLYPPVDEKDREKLLKIDISDSTLRLQKEKLDLQGYDRAMEIHTLEAYDFYLHHFGNTIYLSEAVADRNALAFELTEQENTYPAYYRFMQDYPEASEYGEAQRRYQTLLFQSQTADGTLSGYKMFLKEHPDSPFKKEAIKAIFRLSTVSNSEDSYLQFIREYPESDLVVKAIGRLYHNYREKGGKDFSYDYNFLDLSDSIKIIDQYDDQFLIPVFENDRYGFMVPDGEMIIPYRYDDIDDDYLCGNITEDFLRVRSDGRQLVVSKTGAVIYEQPYNDVQELVSGLLLVLNRGKFGVIYKSGEMVLPQEYDEIEPLSDQLIKTRRNDQWFLHAINGVQILEYGCQNINLEGSFLMVQRKDLWAITKPDRIFEGFLLENTDLDFRYDDYELIEPTQVLCLKGDHEGILNSDLEFRLKMDNQKIYTLPEGWLLEQDSVYHLYDDAFVKISGTHGLQHVVYKGLWITGKSAGKWILYHNFTPFPDVFAYDSVSILSDNYVFALEDGIPVIIFPNYKKVKIEKYEDLKILHSPGASRQDEAVIDYLLVEYGRGRDEIYGMEGNLLAKGTNLDMELLGGDYFKKSYRGLVGLTDTTGQELLKPQFQAIANYDNGYVSLLSNKKFGIYNKNLGIFLKPAYDRLLKPYNSMYLIAYRSGGYGLIDIQGKGITEFIFDEIRYWNDSSLLGKDQDHWNIIDIHTEEILVEDIRDFDLLKDDGEKLMIFRKEEQFGIASNRTGVLIDPTFNDIINIGSNEDPLYFAEKYIHEAAFYIIIYYNSEGAILRKQVFNDEEYDKIYCN